MEHSGRAVQRGCESLNRPETAMMLQQPCCWHVWGCVMAIFVAQVMDGRSGVQGDYDFDGPDDLLSRAIPKIVRHFLAAVRRRRVREHRDYEIFAAHRHRTSGITDLITVSGRLGQTLGGPVPFLCTIAVR